ncbi:MAG TPA: hypothetical protein VN132_07300 [Bdellovibrio sp.]|nr:hypothetical protein [Bdellovibrio sp.]
MKYLITVLTTLISLSAMANEAKIFYGNGYEKSMKIIRNDKGAHRVSGRLHDIVSIGSSVMACYQGSMHDVCKTLEVAVAEENKTNRYRGASKYELTRCERNSSGQVLFMAQNGRSSAIGAGLGPCKKTERPS